MFTFRTSIFNASGRWLFFTVCSLCAGVCCGVLLGLRIPRHLNFMTWSRQSPLPLPVPSIETPFLYLHSRKTGGSTLRNALWLWARDANKLSDVGVVLIPTTEALGTRFSEDLLASTPQRFPLPFARDLFGEAASRKFDPQKGSRTKIPDALYSVAPLELSERANYSILAGQFS
jgi:hypothetical protein